MTTVQQGPVRGNLDVQLAAEIRARCAREGITQHELAERIGATDLWVSRRLSPKGIRPVSINMQELELFAKALRTSWINLLPRQDSDPEPAGNTRDLFEVAA